MSSAPVPFPDLAASEWVEGKLTAIGRNARKEPHQNAPIVLSGFIAPIQAKRFMIPHKEAGQIWYAYLIYHQERIYPVWLQQVPEIVWEEEAFEGNMYRVLIEEKEILLSEASRRSTLILLRLILNYMQRILKHVEEAEKL